MGLMRYYCCPCIRYMYDGSVLPEVDPAVSESTAVIMKIVNCCGEEIEWQTQFALETLCCLLWIDVSVA
jgi:hypothetical protein